MSQLEIADVDIDAPIPYSLTPKGSRYLESCQLQELQQHCEHDWKVDVSVGLICRRCGAEASTRRQSIPSYLAPRERGRR